MEFSDDQLAHYGILRKSGRYPWGSGESQSARNKMFLDHIAGMRQEGMSDTEIARGLGISRNELTSARSIARTEQKQANIHRAQQLKDRGWSNQAIAENMGLANESTVRALLKPGEMDKLNVLNATSDMLKEQVAAKQYIDVGAGVPNQLGISEGKLRAAVNVLQEEGYTVHQTKIEQLGTGEFTQMKVLCPPGTEWKDLQKDKLKVQQITDFSDDGGRTYLGTYPPKSIDSSRVAVRYDEDGGSNSDGLMYVRPGLDDISLGGKNYAQVRVAVDGTHFIKGMAIYKDDLPDGVDIMFNTNKKNTGNKLDALKPMKKDVDGNIDQENPFGASIKRQVLKTNTDGSKEPSSVMNIVNEEGDWDGWSRNLPSQMLSKQSPKLAKTQLDMTYESRLDELNEIKAMTNPSVKRAMLEKYADATDSAAVHLKAAALPRQATQVLIPVESMKDSEIYAPNFRHGEKVVLVRFPHGGTFEIPELTVNNKHPDAKKLLGTATDAVGIGSKAAGKLSGADFDGDTALVIPNNTGKVQHKPSLAKLADFDPQRAYKRDGLPEMKDKTKQLQMGLVSNLISDMTIRSATDDELARAVRHSMVVIDAQKHGLDYKQSAIDNGISQLMGKYQNSSQGGASTLISRATHEIDINERKSRSYKDGGPIDKDTGKRVYVETGRLSPVLKKNPTTGKLEQVIDPKTGQPKTKVKKQSVEQLSVIDDAFELSSGTAIESVYANHSNRLKALANEARKEYVSTKNTPYSRSAKQAYQPEVQSLNAKLNLAMQNKPLERQAQIVANAVYKDRVSAFPDMDADDKKKLKGKALIAARQHTGADKQQIYIEDKEWSAIQAGAISPSRLDLILSNANTDRVTELASPRNKPTVSTTKVSRAKAMLRSGYTQQDVADALGVPLSTLKNYI